MNETDDAARAGEDVSDAVWRRDEVDSPCQKVCLVHPGARICVGCHRTIEEIAGWSSYDAATRARIRAELPGRASLLRADGARPSRRRGRPDRRSSQSDGDV